MVRWCALRASGMRNVASPLRRPGCALARLSDGSDAQQVEDAMLLEAIKRSVVDEQTRRAREAEEAALRIRNAAVGSAVRQAQEAMRTATAAAAPQAAAAAAAPAPAAPAARRDGGSKWQRRVGL
ncbi:hypothetical protein JKP88DRAFT_286170 [Tribonema minus]|uniref:Uncharacterized protein n=1 Tax=Tribonema minus TaxID=303371 RepID=A0A836CNS3_9STRA|nr:hypothetical protein JKP88DRAFT_286170 [Tribonema minus]